jgi:hypothetical protein
MIFDKYRRKNTRTGHSPNRLVGTEKRRYQTARLRLAPWVAVYS